MSRLVRLAAATILVAAAGLTGSTPAYAAACSTATGVTVVVDFHELGGGLHQVCDAGGGGEKASALFPDNDFPLNYVQRQPGFVCRVSGEPADDPCVNTPPANAYWGLWWSDGTSSGWSYSSVGVGSLTIPDGGSVALSWNGSSSKSPPGAPPPQHSAQPTGKPEPTKPPPTQAGPPPTSGGGTSGSSGGGTGTNDTASPGAAPSGAAAGKRQRLGPENGPGRNRNRQEETDGPGETDAASPSAEDSTDADTSPTASDPSASADDSALPVWVGPVAVGGLLGVAAVATYLRRRTV